MNIKGDRSTFSNKNIAALDQNLFMRTSTNVKGALSMSLKKRNNVLNRSMI